jgi:hypothetical protein
VAQALRVDVRVIISASMIPSPPRYVPSTFLRVAHARLVSVGVFVVPKGLKRIYGQGYLHFITFSCYRRLPLLRSAYYQRRGKILIGIDPEE